MIRMIQVVILIGITANLAVIARGCAALAAEPTTVVGRRDLAVTTPHAATWPARAYLRRPDWSRTSVGYEIAFDSKTCMAEIELRVRTDVRIYDLAVEIPIAAGVELAYAPEGCELRAHADGHGKIVCDVDPPGVRDVDRDGVLDATGVALPLRVAPTSHLFRLHVRARAFAPGVLLLRSFATIDRAAIDGHPGAADAEHPVAVGPAAAQARVAMPVPTGRFAPTSPRAIRDDVLPDDGRGEEIRRLNEALRRCVSK